MTVTGVEALVVVPLPSSPLVLLPQHFTVLLARSAHVWSPWLVIAVALARPVTATGLDVFVVVALPSCPEVLLPHHLALPVARSAQVKW